MALAIEFPQVVWSIEFGGDETVVRQVTMTGGGGAGGGGVTVHNDLTGRSDPDTHPISSITGLAAALAAAGNVDSVNGQTGTVSLDLDDLTDVDTTTDPPDADDVLAWDGVTWTPATLTALGAPGLSNATPADLGTAAPGVSTEASRADHVHDLPTAADVGAAASLHVHSGADITSGTVATARLGSGTADSTTFLRGDQTWAAVTPGASALNDLTDVDTATDPPATDDVLAWDGTLWTPAALTAADTGAIPASIIDAKGDLIVGTANDTAARLGVGSDGQVLTADSAEAGGVKWAAAAGGGAVESVNGATGVVVLDAADITVDASGFNGNLTTSDDTVQEIAQKVDDLVIPAAGIADPGGANDDFLQRKSGVWTNRTVAQVQADLHVAGHVPRTQSYIAPGVLSTSGTSGVLAGANLEVYIPMFIPAGTYDAVGVRTTVAGTATWEIALYTADASVRPTSRITSFGSLDMSVAAGRLLITGIGLTVTTSAWYFIGVKATAYTSNPTFYRMATNHWPNGLQGWPIREDAAEGYSHLQKATGLAAGPLPATAPAVGTGTGELNYEQTCPRITLRKV